MFDKWMKYSYAAQKHQRYRLLKVFLCFLVLYVAYNVLTAFFCSIWVLDNDTMQPGLAAGDRLVFVSFALPALAAEFRSADQSLPFKRGNIVLVDTAPKERRKWPQWFMDGFARFFTAQRVSVFGREEHIYLKRVIGFPGDEITMTNFVLRVKPSGSSYSLTEFELSEKPYYPAIPHVPALWDESIPFSGNMDRIILGADECFVVSDDRSNTNDSRTWGPVPADSIIAKAVFRFWPVTKMGRP
ncbi:signal peptidase I [Spirochaetia bacterium]|nr:signal peptidase I [Spirochaetia bacterium]